MSLLTPQGRINLPLFVYKGSDDSLIYKYVTSNLADTLVRRFVPLWVAPNLITFVGFLLQILALIVVLMVSPNFSTESSFYVSCSAVFASFCLFGYSTLDNMDGKQARRTGSSSPLGLLFDHGCDALNAGLIGWAVIALHVCYEGPSSWHTFVFWFIPIYTFYLSTWEEYHIGEFYLPLINGPNEGILFSIITLLSTAFIQGGAGSTSIWSNPPEHEWLLFFSNLIKPCVQFFRQFLGSSKETDSPITLLDLTVISSLLPVTGTVIHHNSRVFAFINRNQANPAISILLAMSRQAPIYALIFSTALWLRCLPCRAAITENWLIFYSTAGSLFVDLLIRLMITHVVKQEFWYSSFALICRILLFAMPPFIFSLYPALMDGAVSLQFVKFALLCAFLCATLCLCGFIHQAIFEISEALDIDVFTIERQVSRLASKKNNDVNTKQNMVVDASSMISSKQTRRSSTNKRQG